MVQIGNKNAFIAANEINTPQVRIADKIKEFGEENTITNTESRLSRNVIYLNENDEFGIE